jgi:hypothetical protein
MTRESIQKQAVILLREYRGWLLIALAILVTACLTAGTLIDLDDFRMRRANGEWQSIDMPLAGPSEAAGTYQLRGRVSFGWFTPRVLHITPDDEIKRITINGRKVDLSDIPPEKLRDWQNGFALNVAPYVRTGANTFDITFTDVGGNIGMDIRPRYGDWRIIGLAGLWLALALAVTIGVCSRRNIPPRQAVLYCLILLGAVLQVWVIYTYNPMDHIWSDPQRHWEQGTDALRNDLMSNTDPVMYQLYVGALAKLSLGLPALVAFYTGLLALITPWLWYRFLRELQGSKTAALAGWAVFSLLPSWMSIYSYFMQETLMLTLLGASLWATWRARRKQTLNAFLVMVLLWALAGLTRGICIPLAAVAVTWLWLVQDGKVRKAVYSTAVLALILGPLTYRSMETVGMPSPHGLGQMNMIYAQSGKQRIEVHYRRDGAAWNYVFQSPAAEAKPFAPLSDWQSRREGAVSVRVDAAEGAQGWAEALDQTSMDFGKYLWVTGENLILLFFTESWPDSNREYLPGELNYLMRWIWAPLGLACLIALASSRRLRRRDTLLPSLILTWFIFQGLAPLAVNEGRYRKPFEGLIVAQAVVLLGAARQPRPAPGAGSAGAGGGPPAYSPPRSRSRPALTTRRRRYRPRRDPGRRHRIN